MSGGSLNYFYGYLEEHVGDFGDKELDDLVKDLAKLFHDREWFLSSDTSEGDWRESRDAFKRKWFTVSGQHERIEMYLDEYRNEVLECFGLSDRRCKNCRHWAPEKNVTDEDFPYGTCDIESSCLMHRSANCEKFEKAVKQDG
jgi:hypothetical protein